MNTKIALRFLAVLVAVLLLAVTSSSAKSKVKDKDLTGTWFVKVPGGLPSGGLTGFYTFHRHGTMSGVVSNIFGGPPQPPPAATHSMDNGIWGRVGHRFESVVYRFSYDLDSADEVSMVRIRMDFSLSALRSLLHRSSLSRIQFRVSR